MHSSKYLHTHTHELNGDAYWQSVRAYHPALCMCLYTVVQRVDEQRGCTQAASQNVCSSDLHEVQQTAVSVQSVCGKPKMQEPNMSEQTMSYTCQQVRTLGKHACLAIHMTSISQHTSWYAHWIASRPVDAASTVSFEQAACANVICLYRLCNTPT